MVFEPLDFKGAAYTPDKGLDKYTVAVQVDEYRNINGVVTKIGHVRRDILIIVVDCGSNELPRLDSVLVRSLPYAPGSVIETGIGQSFEMTFATLDDNVQDIVRISSNATTVLPGATFTLLNTGAKQGGRLSWTPTAADIRTMPYYFTVTVRDNACPMPGFQTFTMGIRVTANGPTGISKPLTNVHFTAYPNPSAGNEVTFKITSLKAEKNTEVFIYNIAGKVVDRIKVAAGEEQVK